MWPRIVTFTGGRARPNASSRSNGTRNIVAVFCTRSSSTVKRFAATLETIWCPPMAALRVERDGHVLRVTLARPERRNAFDAALIAELTEAFAGRRGRARGRALAGEGPSFCAGADVEWQRSSIDLSYDENVEDAMRLYRMLEAIDCCPAPVVCVVHGHALGGGSGLVACADVAVAWPDAVFGFTEVRLGIIPAVISPFVLPQDRRRGASLLPDGRAVRRGGGTADRPRAGGRGGRGTGRRGDRRGDSPGGPDAVREAKRLVRDRPHGRENGAHRGGPADERRGTGRAARVPRGRRRASSVVAPRAPRDIATWRARSPWRRAARSTRPPVSVIATAATAGSCRAAPSRSCRPTARVCRR